MKTRLIKLLSIITIACAFSACSEESVTDKLSVGNEYQIKINGEIYEEGSSLFAGIVYDEESEGTMIALTNSTLGITFDYANYQAGKTLKVGLEDTPDITAVAVGLFVNDANTEDEEIVIYAALSGTVTIVSKKRIEFNLNCCNTFDITYEGTLAEGAESIVISGFITEKSPQ